MFEVCEKVHLAVEVEVEGGLDRLYSKMIQ